MAEVERHYAIRAHCSRCTHPRGVGHVSRAGSTLIPLDELDRRVSEVPRDREVVVSCASGARSRALKTDQRVIAIISRDFLISPGRAKPVQSSRGHSKSGLIHRHRSRP